ncbi:MAG TPA: FtsX-like permease family protein [bacterium]|nr:FtsX-like permease family protein [bacterium]HOL47503.1 FtsX-like permease family protein [bacterium]HPQ19575.1 FtsX-like permease family protein [bacterium]
MRKNRIYISLILLSLKNVFRNFKRSTLTFLCISIGMSAFLIVTGLIYGIETQSIKNYIETRVAHIKIYKQGYFEDISILPLDKTLNYNSSELQKLKNNNYNFCLRILFSANLIIGEYELPCIAAGIDFNNDKKIFKIINSIITKNFDNKDGYKKIYIGIDIANLFKLKIGDIITITSRTKYGTINADDFIIAGFVNTGNPEIDNFYLFININEARVFLDLANDEVTEISMIVDDYSIEKIEKVKKDLRNILGNNYRINGWYDEIKDVLNFFEFRRRARLLISMLLLILASVGVINTMLMSVFERMQEIGTLMALGMSKKKIIFLFISEGAIIGLLGGFFGAIIGGIIVWYFKKYGIDISSLTGFNINVPIKTYIYAYLPIRYYFLSILYGLVLSMFVSFFPAFRASKFNPSEILRK